MTTLEQRLKTALPCGQSLVVITHEGQRCRVLVTVFKNGFFSFLFKPGSSEAIYNATLRITCHLPIVTFATVYATYAAMFDGEPATSIALKD